MVSLSSAPRHPIASPNSSERLRNAVDGVGPQLSLSDDSLIAGINARARRANAEGNLILGHYLTESARLLKIGGA